MRPITWTTTTTTFCLVISVCLHLSGSTYYENVDGMPKMSAGDSEYGRRIGDRRQPQHVDSIWSNSPRRSNIVDNRRDQRQTNEDQRNKKNEWKQRSSTAARSSFWGTQNVMTTAAATRPTPALRIVTSPTVDRSRTPSVTYFIDRPNNVDRAIFQIPVPILLELRNITNPVDFLNRYVVEASDARKSVPAGRNHSFVSSIMRQRTLSAPFAHAAGCTPQPTTVPVQTDTRSEPEPYVMYFPSCTRIERCDGCCNTDLLECQPTKKEMASLQVLRVKYLGPNVNKFDISEPVIVELERHLECDCQCRIKESDCRFYQTYRPNECRCECSNQHESVDCVGERLWDPYTCQCRCRHQHDCSTGYFFNDQTCTCEMMRTRTKPAFRGF